MVDIEPIREIIQSEYSVTHLFEIDALEYVGWEGGSNDLTQLVLGLDRDSALVAHIYDERNTAVKTCSTMVGIFPTLSTSRYW